MKSSPIPIGAALFALISVVATSALTGCGDDETCTDAFCLSKDMSVLVTPDQVLFGSVIVGQSDRRAVTVAHVGTEGTVSLHSARLVTESTELSLILPDKLTLEVGESTDFTLVFEPVDVEADEGLLIIETNVGSAEGLVTIEVPIRTGLDGQHMVVAPNPVEFGEVESGVTESRFVSFINTGAADITIVAINLDAGRDGDFGLEQAPSLPESFAPGDSFTIELSYTPTNGGADLGRLDVDYELGGVAYVVDPSVLVKGREVGPDLVVFPNPVDFGWRSLDVTHEIPMTIANQGFKDLVIDDIKLAADSFEGIAVVDFPGAGTVVAPGNVLPLKVQLTPTASMVATTGPIGALVIVSNDTKADGEYPVSVFGRAEAPLLQVNPPALIDFAYVAQNQTSMRRISLYNAGAAELHVESISLADNITGEYAMVVDEGWGPLASSPTAGVLAPGDYEEVRVNFTNEGADNGTQWAKLVITSDDGTQGVWELDLKALRAGAPVCEVALVPGQLDFGTVPRGHKKTMSVNLVNVGSGSCSFHSALANDCASFFGFFGGSCEDPNNTVQQNGNSAYYNITLTPPAIQGFFKPGDSYPIEVTFIPPETAPIIGDELVDYGGLLGVRVIDDATGNNVPFLFPGPVTGGLSEYAPNLHGKSGIASLVVLPNEVDFGVTTIGCHSQTITVTGYNVGTAPLDITSIELQGCGPEFQVKSMPGLPLVLNGDGSMDVELVYVPQDVGSDSCGIAWYTDSDTPTIVVPIEGGGTYETEHTDTYIQATGQDVDILFVVDSSGSMSDEQNNLSANFSSFINGAATWNNNYQVGVTTMDMDKEAGRLVGSPTFVTTGDWSSFANNVKVGSNGSGTEQGLATAQSALSLPLTSTSQIACGVDADCADPDRCVGGFCGGTNRGFLREDATLEIVFVSDEDDGSPATLAFYINFFKSIKGFYNENLMHAHAIVGPSGGCNSSGGDASPGLRYIDVANATGGNVVSVCDTNFSAGLSSIGDIAFGLRVQFFLSRLAQPGTIDITVAGAGCTSGGGSNWVYDANSNGVIFNENGGCMPQAGEEVQIHYETLCLLE